jgi:hypothetical protein
MTTEPLCKAVSEQRARRSRKSTRAV